MPDAPHIHSALTVWTAQGVSTRALLVTLAVGHRCDDLDRSLDEAFDLGQGLLNEPLERGKGLGRLDSVIAYPLEAFGKHMRHHTPDERVDLHRFPLHPLAPVGAIVLGDPLPLVAIDTP